MGTDACSLLLWVALVHEGSRSALRPDDARDCAPEVAMASYDASGEGGSLFDFTYDFADAGAGRLVSNAMREGRWATEFPSLLFLP